MAISGTDSVSSATASKAIVANRKP